MNAELRKRPLQDEMPPGMSRAVLISLILHAVVVTVGTLGLPYIRKDLPDIVTPVPVEIMDVSDITQTDRPAERAIHKPEEKKEEAKPEPERPKQAPKQTSETPPKPVAPSREELVIPEKTEKPPEVKKEEKPKAKPPEPKRRPTLTQEEEKPQEDPFQSLLKNLQDAKPDPAEGAAEKTAVNGMQAPLGARMTLSEMDALRQQLSQCWSVLAGARYAEDLVVDIKLFMNPDRTVRQARVVDELRYNMDPIFRAAADSALRAVRDPACSPFRLPPEKYDQWKVIDATFDPREIL